MLKTKRNSSRPRRGILLLVTAGLGWTLVSVGADAALQDAGYVQTNLVANWEGHRPQIIEPELKNAWGISLRPAGAGGHWWVTANGSGKSFEYVGDVPGTPLYQDDLKEVTVPHPNGEQGTPTGTVFNATTPVS